MTVGVFGQLDSPCQRSARRQATRCVLLVDPAWQSVWSSELGGVDRPSTGPRIDATSTRTTRKRSPFQPTNETRSPDPFSLTPFLRHFQIKEEHKGSGVINKIYPSPLFQSKTRLSKSILCSTPPRVLLSTCLAIFLTTKHYPRMSCVATCSSDLCKMRDRFKVYSQGSYIDFEMPELPTTDASQDTERDSAYTTNSNQSASKCIIANSATSKSRSSPCCACSTTFQRECRSVR